MICSESHNFSGINRGSCSERARLSLLCPQRASSPHGGRPGQGLLPPLWSLARSHVHPPPSLSSPEKPPEGACEHWSQIPTPPHPHPLLARASRTSAFPGKSPSPPPGPQSHASPPLLLSTLSPPRSLCSSHKAFSLFLQHARQGSTPGRLHELCPLSRKITWSSNSSHPGQLLFLQALALTRAPYTPTGHWVQSFPLGHSHVTVHFF